MNNAYTKETESIFYCFIELIFVFLSNIHHNNPEIPEKLICIHVKTPPDIFHVRGSYLSRMREFSHFSFGHFSMIQATASSSPSGVKGNSRLSFRLSSVFSQQ